MPEGVLGQLPQWLQRGLTQQAQARLSTVPVRMGAEFGREFYSPQEQAIYAPGPDLPSQRWLHESVHALDPALQGSGWQVANLFNSGTMGNLPTSERSRIRTEYRIGGPGDAARYAANLNEEQFAMTGQRVAELPRGANPAYAQPGRGIQPRYQQYFRNIFTPEAMRPTRQDPRAWATRGVRMLPPAASAMPALRQLAAAPRQQSQASKV